MADNGHCAKGTSVLAFQSLCTLHERLRHPWTASATPAESRRSLYDQAVSESRDTLDFRTPMKAEARGVLIYREMPLNYGACTMDYWKK